MKVCSTHTSAVRGVWIESSRNAAASSSGSRRPSDAESVCVCTPCSAAAAPASHCTTWALRSAISSSPGRVQAPIAIWFAIVPLGR